MSVTSCWLQNVRLQNKCYELLVTKCSLQSVEVTTCVATIFSQTGPPQQVNYLGPVMGVLAEKVF